ncbi:hypothetical protein [Gynuella sunshinyii]|uniref:Uncharacterized protein n=1 Tax=Gynuella sunshinyii YC6258 TaxID=1445510 RepID=A0A0C5VRB9_9GAMM|nr:hypothetical protein [Gynuella sunshinyii]AJQ92764.1 hypothetical Protein YC6258_00714 [Gynuella sunshinyii YC6258]
MSACEVKAGFFVLRQCGDPSEGLCEQCGCAVCGLHLVEVEGQMLCTDCAAVQDEAGEEDEAGNHIAEGDDSDSMIWAYGYRRHYYHSYHDHNPLDNQQTFDSDDVAAFSSAAEIRDDAQDDDAPSLFDS